MCGIVGVFPIGDVTSEQEIQRKEAALFLFTELLQITEKRGEDATGVTALFNNCDYYLQKTAKKASLFINTFGDTDQFYNSFVDKCKKNKNKLQLLVGHCRKTSVGNKDNVNNHPIKAGNIIGVHNGTLKNHDTIFNNLNCKRDGVVDSEAIFRLLGSYTKDGTEPFTTENIDDTARRLDGSYSCIAFSVLNPYQVCVFRDMRPLEFILIRSLNLLLVVSEKIIADTAMCNYNRYKVLYSGGEIIKQSDVITKILAYNDLGVIDLTASISKTTIIQDIVSTSNINRVKLWTTTNYQYNSYTGNNNVITTTTNTNTTTDSTTTNKTKSNENVGMIYCKALEKYVPNDKKYDYRKTTFINNNKVNSYNKQEKKSVRNTNNSNTNNDLSKNTSNNSNNTGSNNNINNTTNTTSTENNKSKIIEISASNNTISKNELEIAIRQKANLQFFENNKELADTFGFINKNNLSLIEPFALVNAVQSNIFEKVFIEGYKYKINNEHFSKNIRILKKVIFILSEIINNSVNPDSILMESLLDKAIKKHNSSELDNTLYNLFSIGDLSLKVLSDLLIKLTNLNTHENNISTH
jgi:hypothetical protein